MTTIAAKALPGRTTYIGDITIKDQDTVLLVLEDLFQEDKELVYRQYQLRYLTMSDADVQLLLDSYVVGGTNGAITEGRIGAANGVAPLDSTVHVPAQYLPSYVDDVLEFDNKSLFPSTGEAGKIYVDKSVGSTWRWSGTTYAPIGNTLALGETSTTAYPGDKGKIAYDHVTDLNNPHQTTKAHVGLSNVPNVDATTTANITDSLNKRFVTDAQVAQITNTSGINTGDETQATIKAKLGTVGTSTDGYLTAANFNAFTAKEPGITPTGIASDYYGGDKAFHPLTKAVVGLSNVTDDAQLKISANLSDVSDASVARTNLGLGDSAVKNVGIASGTVASGDHTHTALYEPANPNIQAHISNTANPHGTTKGQVGLANADNTADADKPISTAQAAALAMKEPTITATGVTTDYYGGDKSFHPLTKAVVGLSDVPNVDATLRANHTGTQTATTISDFDTTATALANSAISLRITDTISDGVTDKAPTQNAVFDALTLKSDVGHVHTVAEVTNYNTVTDAKIDTAIAAVTLTSLPDVSDATPTTDQYLKYDGILWSPSTLVFPTTGDMFKSTYDTNDNGIVDNSEALSGFSSAYHLDRNNHTGTQAKSTVGLSNVDNTSDVDKPISTAQQTALDLKVNLSEKGAVNGVAPLGADQLVPAIYLPAYVDEVEEYNTLSEFPATGLDSKLYLAKDTNKLYRWTGTDYAFIGEGVALGETSSTAYAGDKGKIAYDHSQITSGNPHGTTKDMIGLSQVPNLDTSTTANITDSTDKRFVTDAQIAKLGTTSGTNTGDETQATLKSKLGVATTGSDGYLLASDFVLFSDKENVSNKQNDLTTSAVKYPTVDAVNQGLSFKQPTLVSGTTLKTVNSTSLLGAGNLEVNLVQSPDTSSARFVMDDTGTATFLYGNAVRQAWKAGGVDMFANSGFTYAFRFKDTGGVNHAGLRAPPSVTASYFTVLPSSIGTANQLLMITGTSGVDQGLGYTNLKTVNGLSLLGTGDVGIVIPKMWSGTATVAGGNGLASFTIPDGIFTAPPTISATLVVASGAAVQNMGSASIVNGTITTTFGTVRAWTGTTTTIGGLTGGTVVSMANAPNGAVVHIIAVQY